MLLVGLCRNDNDDQQEVTRTEAEGLAAEIGARAYVECSPRTQSGLREVFEKACRVGMEYQEGAGEKKDPFDLFGVDAKKDEDPFGEDAKDAEKEDEEEDDSFGADYKFGVYLYEKEYGEEKLVGKKIIQCQVGCLKRVHWAILKAFVGVLCEEEDEKKQMLDMLMSEETKDLAVREAMKAMKMHVLMEDGDFYEYFDLDSYEQLSDNGAKTDMKIKLKVVFERD